MTSEKLKAIKSQNSLKKIHIKAKDQKHEFQIAQSSSPSVRWKENSSLTQNDTMDIGAWIKFKKKNDINLFMYKAKEKIFFFPTPEYL